MNSMMLTPAPPHSARYDFFVVFKYDFECSGCVLVYCIVGLLLSSNFCIVVLTLQKTQKQKSSNFANLLIGGIY